MKKLKRGLALLLTALMLISALPATVMAAELEDQTAPVQKLISAEAEDEATLEEEQVTVDGTAADTAESDVIAEDDESEETDSDAGISPFGYQHIETVTKNVVDLTGHLQEELKVLPLSVLLPGVDLNNISVLAVDTSSDSNGDGQYEVVETKDGTIDLSNLIRRGTFYDRQSSSVSSYFLFNLEIINSNDQLNKDAIRYIVPIRISNLNSLLDLDVYLDGSKLDTGDYDNYWYCYSNGIYELRTKDGLPVWDIKNTVVSMALNMKLNSAVTRDLTAKVYEGTYLTADDVDAGKEITDDIWKQAASGYNTDWTANPEFTVVLERDGKTAQVINFTVRMVDKYVGFDFNAFTVATDDKPAEEFDVYVHDDSSYDENAYYLDPRNYDTWQSGKAALKLQYKAAAYINEADYSDYAQKTDVAVYTGYYKDEAALNVAVRANQSKEITDDIWAADGEGYIADYTDWENRPAFTVVVKEKESGDTAYVAPFYVYMYAQYDSPVQVGVSDTLYVENPSSSTSGTSSWNRASEKHTPDWVNGTDYYTMRYTTAQEVIDGHSYPTDGKYYVQFYVYGGNNNTRDQLAEIDRILDKDGNDVKDAMLGSYGYNYYQVDFSEQPVIFTVYFKDKVNEADGTTEEVASQVIRLRTLPAQPSTASAASTDTYFNVTGVDGYQTYTMSPHVDSSYRNGFQVLFVDATKEELEANKVTIQYSTGSGVRMFREHDEHGELIDTTGELTTAVKSGEPIFFSAASESGTHLRNYWVTLIAKGTEGPKLWVNGQDDMYHIDSATKLPMREVFIGYGSSGSYYDIFFANIGDEALEDLTVTLSSDANIRLDEYWTIGDTTTLAPFTSIKPADNYSELENMAKIRIWPKDSTSKGDIDAILTISAKDQEPISIKLTGKVGQAAIVSSNVPDGVKYVPYSVLIQTNFQSSSGNASNRPTFRIAAGTLPSGLNIRSNTGEIYGVPMVWSSNTFTFTVGIYQGGQLVDSRSFSMYVAENTDDNVWYASDMTYEVLQEIGDRRETNNENMHHFVIDLKDSEILDPEREDLRTFVSYGPYIYYEKLFLDGNELKKGVDYIHEEGSTKIVLNENTIKSNNTNGDHTLALEFREGNSNEDTYATMKRTAQNYTIEGGVTPSTPTPPPASGGNTSSSTGGTSSSDDSSSGSNNNQKPSTPSGKTFPFVDVRTGDWHYNDVYWVWDQGLMTGVSSSTFAPDIQISQAMIVVTLANLANINLTAYENVSVDGAALGAWYTTAAAWAQQTGILPDYTTFNGENGAYSRDGMAIMLVKYLASMGVDTTVGNDITFDDMDQMTAAGRDAFRVLCHYGIFKGVGDNRMDPGGVTTRAQFAALVHRTSDFVISR